MKSDKRGVLVCLSPDRANELVKLRRDATILGREKADIIIDDSEISSTHCQIQNISDTYHVFDMNSSNGTFVNNQRIVKAKLSHGDVITIGRTSFRFSLEDESKVRHIPTLFKSKKAENTAYSIVDTIIEKELRSTQERVLHINVTYGNGVQENLTVHQPIIYLGRATSFGKFDQDPEISRKHLMVKLNETGQVFIEDQGSTNGSFLNGKKITGLHPVKPSDEIKIGLCRIYISPTKNKNAK
ncbi:MAG: FHA domain-containing protein [Oligoflexales bacterium]